MSLDDEQCSSNVQNTLLGSYAHPPGDSLNATACTTLPPLAAALVGPTAERIEVVPYNAICGIFL
jgi:hypothetical protein